MPDEATRGDSLRIYLTGAASDGAEQTDPDASLGNYRSSSEETFFTQTVTSAISNVTIDHISGAHDEGDGTLTATGTSELAWTPPGGTQGSAVTIANGETKILEGGDEIGEFIRVSRTSADDLTGTATVTLAIKYNNGTGFDNVSTAEAAAGDTEYRALMLKNDSDSPVINGKIYVKTLGTQLVSGSTQLSASGAGTIVPASGNFLTWPSSGFCRVTSSADSLKEIVYYSSRTSSTLTVPSTGRGLLGTSAVAGAATDKIYPVPGVRLGLETPSSNAIQAIANESTAPTSISWTTAITSTAGLSLGDLDPADMVGLWIERVTAEGASSQGKIITDIGIYYEAT